LSLAVLAVLLFDRPLLQVGGYVCRIRPSNFFNRAKNYATGPQALFKKSKIIKAQSVTLIVRSKEVSTFYRHFFAFCSHMLDIPSKKLAALI
jgi:hypothetical protein